jgi:lipopolysaccharide export system protein LptA
MQLRAPVTAALLTLLFTATALAQKDKDERLRIVHADVLRQENVDGKIVQELVGNVEFRQGDTIIRCDMATQLTGRNVYLLAGNVDIFDQQRSLTADTVYIYETDRKQVAIGHVKSTKENQVTQADRITYLDEQNRVLSEGNVRLANNDERSLLTGSRAEYWRDLERGQITGNPQYAETDSAGIELTRINADTLDIYDDRNLMIARKNVVITKKSTLATCNYAEFDKSEEQIRLHDNPEVVHKNQTIAGDTLNLYVRNSEIDRLDIVGHAVATSDADTTSKGRWLNKMTGQKMQFLFDGARLQRIVIEDQATSIYHIISDEQYKGISEVSGDKITIEFAEEKAQEIVVTSHPDVAAGKFTPAK